MGNRTGLTVVHPWKKVMTKKETHQAIQWNAPVDNLK